MVLKGKWIVLPSTPPFPPDTCYLSDAPCQMIVRQLSGACQMPHQTSVNFHQTSSTYTPDTYHMVYVWCICGTCLTNVWWGIWQTPDNHLTGSMGQIAGVWREQWCNRASFQTNLPTSYDRSIVVKNQISVIIKREMQYIVGNVIHIIY